MMMTELVKAKIFLGDESRITETDWFRTRNLFNAGSYIGPHRQSFDSLYLLNEETLAPGRSISTEVAEDSCLLLLPVWGTLKYTGSGHNAYQLQPGEILWVPTSKRHMYSITNLEQKENIHFIQILLKQSASRLPDHPVLLSMDAQDYQNQFLAVGNFQTAGIGSFFLAQFAGRKKGSHSWPDDKNVFIYCLQGALEVEERLLHAGDGLGLWQIQQIDWEALSQHALFLAIAFPATPNSEA